MLMLGKVKDIWELATNFCNFSVSIKLVQNKNHLKYIKIFFNIIYFGLCWVFVAARTTL